MPTLMRRIMVWGMWFVTWLLLLAGLLSPRVYVYVVYFSAIHALLFVYLEEGILSAFPVQVRLVFLLWVAVGTYVPYMTVLMLLATAILACNLVFGYCLLSRLLYLLPFNRHEPLSLGLVKRVVLSPPVPGQFQL